MASGSFVKSEVNSDWEFWHEFDESYSKMKCLFVTIVSQRKIKYVKNAHMKLTHRITGRVRVLLIMMLRKSHRNGF